MTILRGLRVIEISGNGSAATAAKHLADWGADVTILEPPGGTALRDEPPYYDVDGDQRSATWAWLSRGKTAVRGISTDDARALCERADVVLAEHELIAAVLGVEPSDVQARFEGRTTFVRIAPFAPDGPYADYGATDLGVNALSGWSSVLGEYGREPLSIGRGIVWRITGLCAFTSALIALRHVQQGGVPQFVEVSAQALAASMISAPWLTKTLAGLPYERHGNLWPLGVMECADGYVGCPPLTADHWERLCYLLSIADVLDDPKGRDPNWRIAHGAELYERVKPWLNERTRAQVFEEAQAWRLPSASVQTIAERLDCPQLEARGFWSSVEIDGKTVKAPRVPYSIKGVASLARPPLREVETVDVPAPSGAPRGASGASALPFEGLRIIDLTAFWSGPYATMLLGTLGADVVKIESLRRPDPYRFQLAPARKERWYEWGPVFNDCNCDKRAITLDVSTDVGKELLERLIEQADVVISNFANRVMPNLGLDNESLLELNPRVIAVTMPGYGPGGPWEDYVGYAIPFEQMVLGSMNSYPDGIPFYGAGFCDPMVGLYVVAALSLALRRREETNEGVEVEVPQCELLDSLFAPEQIAVQHGAPMPSRRGNKHEWMAPHDAYRTAGDDAWITIAVSSDAEFAALARELGLPDLAMEDRFATVDARKENEAALDERVATAVRERHAIELERALQSAGVKACRVVKGYALPQDDNLRHIGFFEDVAREVTGTHAFKTWPFRFTDIDTSHKRPPPLLGEHNREVLTSVGVTDEELAHLEADGVIGYKLPTG
ncbi:MAG: CoA transferase [Dehalococcoidia bacterium]